MNKEIISIETLQKLNTLEKQKQEALDFIEKKCVYDKHLKGYCMGLTSGEVKTLVLKIKGGIDER